jgi:hypothetical protein
MLPRARVQVKHFLEGFTGNIDPRG